MVGVQEDGARVPRSNEAEGHPLARGCLAPSAARTTPNSNESGGGGGGCCGEREGSSPPEGGAAIQGPVERVNLVTRAVPEAGEMTRQPSEGEEAAQVGLRATRTTVKAVEETGVEEEEEEEGELEESRVTVTENLSTLPSLKVGFPAASKG